MKLGLGELEQIGSEGYSREFTQIRFLIITEKIKPQILIEARDNLYPLFRDLLDTIPKDQLDEFCIKLNTGWQFLESVSRAKAFLDNLFLWTQRWNLEADWCIDRTFMAMRRYYGIKAILSDFSWFYPLDTMPVGKDGKKPYKDKIDRIFDFPLLENINVHDFPVANPPSPPKGLPTFEPYHNRLGSYIQHIESIAKQKLDNDPYLSLVEPAHRAAYAKLVGEETGEYAKQVIAYANSQVGLKQVKTKSRLETHLEWTVRVWVLGENYTTVAKSATPQRNGERPTRKAIKKAVKEILELIEPTWATQLEKKFPKGRPKSN